MVSHVVLICISKMTNAGEHIIHVLIEYSSVLLCEVPIQVFCPYFELSFY